MKRPIFTGSAVALVTPFKDRGVDLETLEGLLGFQLENGTDAVVVCGTTGEASTMTYEERAETIGACVRHVGGRVPVIAGSGSNSTEIAVALSQEAERQGADALLVVTPYYNKATQAGLIRHYRTIADAVSIPIILYDVPSRTGVSIAPETYAALAEHPNIAGVKEASGDLGSIQRTRALCPEDFCIWSGNDDETVPICALGGKGVISVLSNVMPQETHDIVSLYLEGKTKESLALQLRLLDLCKALFIDVNPIPVKEALNLMGMGTGHLRMPLTQMEPANVERLEKAMKNYGLL